MTDLKMTSLYGTTVCLHLIIIFLVLGQVAQSQPKCMTTGGYVTENTPCVFPFTYVDPRTRAETVINSCEHVGNAFIMYMKPRKKPRPPLSPSYSGQWCATSSRYSQTDLHLQKQWGYCNCGDLSVSEGDDSCQNGLSNVPCAFAPSCTGSWTYSQAEDICKLSGARLCSVSELVDFKLGRNSCLNTPTADAPVWTLDSCVEQPPTTNPRYIISGGGKVIQPTCAATNNNASVVGIRCCRYPNVERKRSILMIIADDMRTDTLTAYGRKLSVTPALDKFATDPRTVVFEKSYANYAQCSPSRLSFLTGLSPDTTGALEISDWLAIRTPDNLTIPEFFRSNGFTVMTGGKVFHEKQQPVNTVQSLWNETYAPFQNQYTFDKECKNAQTKPLFMSNGQAAGPGMMCLSWGGADSLIDFALERRATYALTKVAMSPETPFFIAVGFYKPHLPWVIHKNYWSMVPTSAPTDSTNGPQPSSTYLPIFYDVDASLSAIGGNSSPWGAASINPDFINLARRAYSAALTQTDSRVQVLLDRLDQLLLADTTMVVLFGDNGFNLGENGLWNKDTMFETALRVPLMIRVPWAVLPKPQDRQPIRRATSHFIELLDLYRTMAGLLDMSNEVDPWIQGHDYSRYVMAEIQRGINDTTDNPLAVAADEAYGQTRRCGYILNNVMINKECFIDQTGQTLPVLWMGYTVRTPEWRYMVWLNAPNGQVEWQTILGEELYDHHNDQKTIFDYVDGVSYNMEHFNVAPQNLNVTRLMLRKIMYHFR